MKKHLLAVILVFSMLSSFSAAYAGKSEASETVIAAAPSVTAAPSPTEQPETSAEPVEDDLSEVTESIPVETSEGDQNQNLTGEEETEEDEAKDYTAVLKSDESAMDFLEGYWTNGRSDYIYAGKGEELINWQTNLPYPSCSLYVLEDGVLRGKVLNTKSKVDSYDIFSLEIIDDDTLKVTSFYTKEETEFIRDSLTVDPSNLTDSYVFWTMERAAVYLEGEWMSPDLDYFILSNEDSLSLSTNLPCPTGMEMGFCDLTMCAISSDENGKKSFEKAYGFEILGKDTMKVHCFSNGQDYEFSRTSAEIDTENLDPDYVFYCDSRAYAFLKGQWYNESRDRYFSVTEENGNIAWKTSLPLDKHYTYRFAHSSLLGVDYDEDGNLVSTAIYVFDIVSHDEIRLYVVSEDATYTLYREADES